MVHLNNKANVIIIQNSKFKMIAKVHFNKILIRFCAGIWNHDRPTRVFSYLLASFLLYGIRIFPTDHFSRICSQYATVATSNISQRLYIQQSRCATASLHFLTGPFSIFINLASYFKSDQHPLWVTAVVLFLDPPGGIFYKLD